MSTALTAFYDMRDVLLQNQKNLQHMEGRLAGSSQRHQRLASLSTEKLTRAVISKLQQQQQQLGSPVLGNRELLDAYQQQELSLLAARRLDRSLSEPVHCHHHHGHHTTESRAITGQQAASIAVQQAAQQQQQPRNNVNSSRYKTELCRPFEENGYCKYGDKCQFAHGSHELRSLARHPKYKTELCRTFHTIGFCPYGPRCHFIHNEDERRLSQINQLKVPASASSSQPISSQQARPRALSFNLPLVRESLGSTADSSPPSSIADSPSMSPTWLNDDYMGLRYSPPASAPAASVPAFTFPGSSSQESGGSLSPLNVDTMASLSAGLSGLSLCHTSGSSSSSASSTTSEVGLQQLRDALADVFYPPTTPSPPDSPLDLSRPGLRLPIFSQLSTE